MLNPKGHAYLMYPLCICQSVGVKVQMCADQRATRVQPSPLLFKTCTP